jgi:hypothetical protein
VGRGGELSVARPPGGVIGAPQAPLKITRSSDTRWGGSVKGEKRNS